MAKSKKYWIQDVVAQMKEKGTIGAFGKATKKKIARAKKMGGVMKKRAVLAETLTKLARKRKRKRATTPARNFSMALKNVKRSVKK